MIVGVVLILIGLALVFFSGQFGRAARLASFIGAVIAILGLVLVALDVFDSSSADAMAFLLALPLLGMVVPGGVGEPVVAAPATPEKSWLPTRKWYALVAGGLASIVASWIISGAFDDVERGMCATLLVGAVTSYFKGNEDTPGGVPLKK